MDLKAVEDFDYFEKQRAIHLKRYRQRNIFLLAYENFYVA